jgi:ubiquinone biosynthesis monooxygenase Coq7
MIDQLLIAADHALRTLSGTSRAARPIPSEGVTEPEALAGPERQHAGALMRVNHVGEICAQALYQAQGVSTRDPVLKAHFEQAAREENDHLAWTMQRLRELGARPSLLNPLWYASAFGVGLLAGCMGDPVSLGFLAETERQVEQHLASHLERLPEADTASRAIVKQMKQDEARHGEAALAAGGTALPAPVSLLMRAAARVMTITAHYI